MVNEVIFTCNFVENPLVVEIMKASVHECVCARALGRQTSVRRRCKFTSQLPLHLLMCSNSNVYFLALKTECYN